MTTETTAEHPPPSLTDPTGREHLLTGETITIGRAVENDIVITSKRVSREHARVRRDGWKAILEDMGSTNGTFLNDERLLASTELHDKDNSPTPVARTTSFTTPCSPKDSWGPCCAIWRLPSVAGNVTMAAPHGCS